MNALPFAALILAIWVLFFVASHRDEHKCERSGGVWHDKQCWTKIE